MDAQESHRSRCHKANSRSTRSRIRYILGWNRQNSWMGQRVPNPGQKGETTWRVTWSIYQEDFWKQRVFQFVWINPRMFIWWPLRQRIEDLPDQRCSRHSRRERGRDTKVDIWDPADEFWCWPKPNVCLLFPALAESSLGRASSQLHQPVWGQSPHDQHQRHV